MLSQDHQAFLAAPTKGKTVSVATNTGSVAATLKWTGSGSAATVAIAAGGDWTFTTDGSTADTTVGLPTANGTLDVSDATADTVGEIEANINASSNWQIQLVGALRSDSANNTFATVTATDDCCNAEGLDLIFDPAVAMGSGDYGGVSLCISADKFFGKTGQRKHSEEGFISSLFYVIYNLTYASGTAYIDVYLCDDVAKTDTRIARFPAGATTVAKEIGNIAASCIQSPAGKRIVVRPTGSAVAFTAGYGTIVGKAWSPSKVIYD